MITAILLKDIVAMTVSNSMQTCQLTRPKRVRPAFEFQARLTRTVAENPLKTVKPQL